MSSCLSLPLLCHPATRSPCPATITVDILQPADGGLALTFHLAGDLSLLRIPDPASPGPADHLWEHTCCEAFIAADGDPTYREFNFSPSGQWATYDFASYRQRLVPPPPPPPPALAPVISQHRLANRLELKVVLAAALLPSGGHWQLGLSAVTEALDGGKTYWALAHPAPRPDFHRREAFTLNLATPAINF